MSLQEKQEEPIQQIFNVNNDAEFEALITACVQAASERNVKIGELHQMISQVWKGNRQVKINQMKNKRLRIDIIETEEQKMFRKKAEKLLEEYPEMLMATSAHLSLIKRPECTTREPWEKDPVKFFEPITEQDFVLELLCAIHKMYTSEIANLGIGFVELNKYVRSYLQNVFEERPELSSCDLLRYYLGGSLRYGDGLFKRICRFNIASNGVVEKTTIGGREIILNGTDLTIRPIYDSDGSNSKKMFSIYYAKEWRDIKEERFPGNVKFLTRDVVVLLIWFIENFF